MIQQYPRNYSHGYPQGFPQRLQQQPPQRAQRNSPELLQEMPLRVGDRRDGHKLNMPMYLWVGLTCSAIFAICYFLNANLNANSAMHQSYSASTIPVSSAR